MSIVSRAVVAVPDDLDDLRPAYFHHTQAL